MISSASQHEVVHLVSPPSETTTIGSAGRLIPASLCAGAINDGLVPPGRIVAIGDSSCVRQGSTLGLRCDTHRAPLFARPTFLRRQIKALTQNASRVICWNDELAALLNPIKCPTELISTSPSLAPSHLSKRVAIRAFTQYDANLWIDRGHSVVIESQMHPRSSFNQDALHPTRAVLRDMLNIDHESICLGLVSDRPSDVDAREFGFLLGLLNASGYTLTGIVPSAASHLDAARRHHRGLGSRFQLLIATDPMTTILPVFDALIYPLAHASDSSGSSLLLQKICNEARVPLLSLRPSSREGLSRAPAVAAPIIKFVDELIASRESAPAPELVHA